jgi:asparagine synthase (glutamine-hydrolysing)
MHLNLPNSLRAVCGIAGYVGDHQDGLLKQMITAIRSRGPDDEQQVISGRTHLGFTRLSINGLGASGQQPMASTNGQYITMMNGEIYNAPELRKSLESKGYLFRGLSDAEIIPHGFSEWGTDLFTKLRGMFAIVICDRQSETILLARDHFGIKPLYYSRFTHGFAFSSSARAVGMHPKVGFSLRESAIGEILRFRYCPSGESMFAKVDTVRPGEWVIWKNGSTHRRTYWQNGPYVNGDKTSVVDWVDKFTLALENSVAVGMLSDVPLGILLSGGVDSGAVAFFASRQNREDLLAFTYAMPGKHDESLVGRAIAADSGVQHLIVHPGNESFADSYIRAIRAMDNPVTDSIIVPTYNLLKSVSAERKVVLTGEGADELLGGYAHIGPLLKLGKVAKTGVPLSVVARLLAALPSTLLNRFFPYEAELGVKGHQKICDIVRAGRNPGLALESATSIFSTDELRRGTSLADLGPVSDVRELGMTELVEWGYKKWLPNQILNKMDQLSMAHGVEARVPFVDPVLYDLVRTMPLKLLVSRQSNKVVLRKSLQREGYRWSGEPKRAFFLPPSAGQITELSVVAEEWLCDSMLKKHGVVSKKMATDAVAEMRNGDFIASKQVATLAGLHIWLDQSFNS